MAIAVRRTGWYPFGSLMRQFDVEFDALMHRGFGPDALAPARPRFVPAADVRRDGNDLVVTLELPGVTESDVQVEIADGRLVVTGERRSDESAERGGMVVREIRSGSFRRSFGLPHGTTAEQVNASYQGGLLTLRVHEVVPTAAVTRVPVQGLPTAELPTAEEPPANETPTAEEIPAES